MQQVLQLDESLALIFHFPIVPRDDVSEFFVFGKLLVDGPLAVLRAPGPLLPDGSGAGGRQTVRMAAQLEPAGAPALQEDVARGGAQIQRVLKFKIRGTG